MTATLADSVAGTVRRLHVIAAQIAELGMEADALKAMLRANLDAGTYSIDGVPAVRISPQRRFDPALAEQTLPGALLDLCIVRRVDGAQAKRVLPPEVYASCLAESGEPRVTLL